MKENSKNENLENNHIILNNDIKDKKKEKNRSACCG